MKGTVFGKIILHRCESKLMHNSRGLAIFNYLLSLLAEILLFVSEDATLSLTYLTKKKKKEEEEEEKSHIYNFLEDL